MVRDLAYGRVTVTRYLATQKSYRKFLSKNVKAIRNLITSSDKEFHMVRDDKDKDQSLVCMVFDSRGYSSTWKVPFLDTYVYAHVYLSLIKLLFSI